jgi:hypothetical protein
MEENNKGKSKNPWNTKHENNRENQRTKLLLQLQL